MALYQASDTTGSVPREQYEYSSYGITNILDQNGLVKTFDHDINVNTPEVKKVKSDFSNPFGYHGMWRDEHTGLYHTHYRLYDPQHVRWLTPDPAGYRDGQNLYRFYAGPNGVDVLGLDLKGQSGYYSTDDLFDLYALFEEGKNSEATFKALLEDLNLYNDFGALPSGSNKKEEMLEVIELLINMSIADDESTLMEEIEKSEKIRQDNQSDGMKALAITGKTLSPLPKIANATAEEVLTSFIPVGKIVTWGKRIKAVAAIMRGGGKVLSYTASKLALFKSRVSKSIAAGWTKYYNKYGFTSKSLVKIKPHPTKSTTILGRFDLDLGEIKGKINPLETTDFSKANAGNYNFLNVADDIYQKDKAIFFEKYNIPFLDAAIKRGDEIILATKPGPNTLFYPDGSISTFGKEFNYLINVKKMKYDSLTGRVFK